MFRVDRVPYSRLSGSGSKMLDNQVSVRFSRGSMVHLKFYRFTIYKGVTLWLKAKY